MTKSQCGSGKREFAAGLRSRSFPQHFPQNGAGRWVRNCGNSQNPTKEKRRKGGGKKKEKERKTISRPFSQKIFGDIFGERALGDMEGAAAAAAGFDDADEFVPAGIDSGPLSHAPMRGGRRLAWDWEHFIQGPEKSHRYEATCKVCNVVLSNTTAMKRIKHIVSDCPRATQVQKDAYNKRDAEKSLVACLPSASRGTSGNFGGSAGF